MNDSPALFTQPADVKTQVEFAEGGVVSRPVLRTEHGRIILFAFDAGQGLSEHTAPFEALVTVLEGRGVFTVAGVEHSVESGQSLMMPAHIPHAVSAVEAFKMLLVMIKPDA